MTVPRSSTPGAVPRSTIALMSRRPVSSPTGLAPARQNFRPLYCLGLWLAVSMMPGMSSEPDAK